MEKNFPDKQIQLVETGYPSKWAISGTSYDYTATYPYSHEGQRKYTADLITLLNKHAQVNGLSWWYAEANAKGCKGDLATGWYNASLFDNETGRALPALYELKDFLEDDISSTIGDANGDGIVNAADIVEIVNYIMGTCSDKFVFKTADANGDGTVNTADIVSIANIILTTT